MSKTQTPKWWETKPAVIAEAIMCVVIGGIFSYLKPTIGVPVLIVLFCIGSLLLWKAYSKQSIWVAVFFVLLSVVSLSIWQLCSKESLVQKQSFATPDALISPVLKDIDIHISELARESTTIRNRAFINCHIYGPGIMTGANLIITNSTADVKDMNSFFCRNHK